MPPFRFLAPEWIEETGSTNTLIKERLAQGAPLPRGLAVAARRQTRGRGRMGNAWLSEPGRSLAFSFPWRPEDGVFDPARAGTLPQAAALGVADFLAGLGAPCRIRWPNDVLGRGGKLCGILAESFSGSGGRAGLILGVGLNVREIPDLAARTGVPAGSVEGETGLVRTPEELLPGLLARIAIRVTAWEENGFDAIRRDLAESLWGMGEPVRIRTPGGEKTGRVAGLGPAGELLLRDADNALFSVNSIAGVEGFGD